MRRLSTVLLLMGLVVGMMAAPALADRPVEILDEVTFTEPSFCTGEVITITIVFDVEEHFHGDRFIANVRRSGTTSDGFVMVSGKEVFIGEADGFKDWFRDVWEHPDGRAFIVRGVFEVRGDEVIMDEFRVRCFD